VSFRPAEPYAPRPTAYLGLLDRNGWRIRSWFIHHPDAAPDMGRFSLVVDEAVGAALPQPAVTDRRPGAAVLIAHQGKAVDYLVLGWWDNENELPLRVWVDTGLGWRAAEGSESICVWDLEVLWRERERYVAHVLAADPPDVEAYLTAPA
jgi:hypothetical protein